MAILRTIAIPILLLIPLGHADVRACLCDVARPETMQGRECSLCRAADEQPAGSDFLAIRDASPNKPHRWLAIPRFHGTNPQDLAGMTPEQRTAYWTMAIEFARKLWGDDWGLAINSLERRSQCHMHIHIGKLTAGAEDSQFVVVGAAADFPLPRQGDGMWVHSITGKFHVHYGNDSPELLLQR